MRRSPIFWLAAWLTVMAARGSSADTLNDPTRPPGTKPAGVRGTANSLRLEAVMRSGNHAVAIIAGRIVRVGDSIGTARIVEILPNGVRYSRDGRSHELLLNDDALRVRGNIVPVEDGP